MNTWTHFTLVFEGNIRDFSANPHRAITPFGTPIASSTGDALSELDALELSHARLIEALDELLTMIGKARVDLATIDKAETALSQAGGRTP